MEKNEIPWNFSFGRTAIKITFDIIRIERYIWKIYIFRPAEDNVSQGSMTLSDCTSKQ